MYEALKAKAEAEFQKLMADGRSAEEKFLDFFNLGAAAHEAYAASQRAAIAVIEDATKNSAQKLADLIPLVKEL